jgi:hypothetical protein
MELMYYCRSKIKNMIQYIQEILAVIGVGVYVVSLSYWIAFYAAKGWHRGKPIQNINVNVNYKSSPPLSK